MNDADEHSTAMASRARLIQATEELRRKIFTRLPWGIRLATMLFNLRFAADARSFGQLVYGLFHIYGVDGLPRTPFVPETVREIDRLSDGYGAAFGHKAQNIVRKYLHDTDSMDEVLSVSALKLMSSKSFANGVRGKTLHEAENYVLRIVQNQAIDTLRAEKVRRHDDITELIREPGSWEQLGEMIPEREQDRIKQELQEAVSPRLMPDLPEYFDLLLDGYSNKQIAEQRLLPSLREKPITQQALAKYRDKIKNVLREHFQVQASEVLGWGS